MILLRPRLLFSTVLILVVLTACVSGTGNDPNAILKKPDLVIVELIGGVTAIELGPKGFGKVASYSLTVHNQGEGPALITVSASKEWITPVDTTVTIAAGKAGSISFTALCGAVEETREGTLTLTSSDPDSPAVIPVLLECVELPPSEFEIDVVYFGSFTDGQKILAAAAAERWSELITGDLPDVAGGVAAGECYDEDDLEFEGQVDDLVIFIGTSGPEGLGGALAQAGPCLIRTVGSDLPYAGLLEFDLNELASMEDEAFSNTVRHEIGHILGIGTLWEHFDLIEFSGSECEPDPDATYLYSGAKGIAGHEDVGGTGKPIVENDHGEGTACGHWHEDTYWDELMTGFLDDSPDNPISAMTVGSLEDLGYEVDYTLVDDYSIPDLTPTTAREGIRLREILISPFPR